MEKASGRRLVPLAEGLGTRLAAELGPKSGTTLGHESGEE